MSLKEKIINKNAKVAIIGLGYVGLPHTVEISRAGFTVLGIDIRKQKIDDLNNKKSYIDDITDEDIKEIVEKHGFKAFNNFEPVKEADVVIICVPTPLDKNKLPDISYIRDSVNEVKKYLRNGQLIILESTTYPGTTDEVVLPILQGTGLKCENDFYLAFAPERIDPGNAMLLTDVAKVVGGCGPKSTELAVSFYSQFLKNVHPVSSTKTAEMTKILENTYRLVNISMVNELSLLCGKMGIDIWEVIEAAKTKPYGFQPFYPSPKIGGHCIPLDPFYLSYKAREYNFWARFIELAGEINEQMPHVVVTRINYFLNKSEKPINGSKILVWGIAYKKDIGDPREAAVFDIVPDLIKKGATVDYFDPYIKEVKIEDKTFNSIEYRPEILKNYDLVLILADHSGFDYEEVANNANLVVDTRNAIKSRNHNNVSSW